MPITTHPPWAFNKAQIDLETIRVKGADATYSQPSDLRQMYNDLKAYVGRENEEDKLL